MAQCMTIQETCNYLGIRLNTFWEIYKLPGFPKPVYFHNAGNTPKGREPLPYYRSFEVREFKFNLDNFGKVKVVNKRYQPRAENHIKKQ